MHELERQFLPEEKRDRFSSFKIKETTQLHMLIERFISETLDYLSKHPNEGLFENEQPEVDISVRKFDKEIHFLESKLAQKYPNYDYHYGDYYPGTLMSKWKHFLKLFKGLFSRDNFSMSD